MKRRYRYRLELRTNHYTLWPWLKKLQAYNIAYDLRSLTPPYGVDGNEIVTFFILFYKKKDITTGEKLFMQSQLEK
jgi:hypothetical protein